jgi:RNA polymerase sigma factor (sigma-70 family)
LPPIALEERFITENDLITRVIGGDKHATVWFVHRFERLVNTIVKEMPIHARERDDVFQQVFAKLREQDYRRLRMWQGRGRGRLASYLSTIIRRTAFDWMRKHIRLNRWSASCKPDPLVEHIGAELTRTLELVRGVPLRANPNTTLIVDTEALTKLKEQKRAIRRAVTEMLHRDSEILRRRYYLGQSYAEIGGAMGMTINSVGVALTRAQKRMHNKLCLRYPGLF